jgi:hypothetical protein
MKPKFESSFVPATKVEVEKPKAECSFCERIKRLMLRFGVGEPEAEKTTDQAREYVVNADGQLVSDSPFIARAGNPEVIDMKFNALTFRKHDQAPGVLRVGFVWNGEEMAFLSYPFDMQTGEILSINGLQGTVEFRISN